MNIQETVKVKRCERWWGTIHEWSNWEVYDTTMVHLKSGQRFNQHKQRRHCTVCNKTQTEEI